MLRLRTIISGLVLAGVLAGVGWYSSAMQRAESARALVTALDQDDVSRVKQLIRAGAAVETESRGKTPLLLLAQQGDREGVRLVLERGAEIDRGDWNRWTALMHAARRADLPLVRLLIERGADVNRRADGGDTPLLWAARAEDRPGEQLEIVRLLLDRGADIDAQDDSGHTAVTSCVTSNRIQLLRLLIARGANLNLRYLGRDTALDMAGGHGYGEYTAVARLLRGAGAGRPRPLKPRLLEAVHRRDARGVDALLREGAGPDTRDARGRPVLHLAVAAGDLEVARVLLRRGAKVEIRDREGTTTLMGAARTARGDLRFVHLLLALRAEPNARDRKGETALTAALRRQDPPVVEALRLAGAREKAAPAREPAGGGSGR